MPLIKEFQFTRSIIMVKMMYYFAEMMRHLCQCQALRSFLQTSIIIISICYHCPFVRNKLLSVKCALESSFWFNSLSHTQGTLIIMKVNLDRNPCGDVYVWDRVLVDLDWVCHADPNGCAYLHPSLLQTQTHQCV